MKKLFKVFVPPFKYDPYGQKILDSKNSMCLEVRGWGKFQYQKDGDKLQDEFGEYVAKLLNDNQGDF